MARLFANNAFEIILLCNLAKVQFDQGQLMMTHHDFIDLGPFLDPKKDVDEEKIDLSKSQLTYSPGRTKIHF